VTIKKNIYHDTLKMEFKSLLEGIVESKRREYHVYTVHRVINSGIMLGFHFKYVKSEDPEKYAEVEFYLGESGKISFVINLETQYAILKPEGHKEILKDFVHAYDTRSDIFDI
jgi:hypothetical protein